MLNLAIKETLGNALTSAYPRGTAETGTCLGPTRQLVDGTVNALARVLKQCGTPVTVGLEVARSKSGPSVVRGLIIFTGTSTSIVEMTLAPSLVRLASKPIYLGHKAAATMLLNAILREIEFVLTEKSETTAKACDGNAV